VKNILVALLTAAVLSTPLLAQNASPSTPQVQPPTPPSTQPRIAPGSVIPVQLTKTIDAKKAKTGDEVVAKVTQDMKTQSGDILVPKDTKVIGRVTEAQARSKEQKESQLAIAFDQAVLKNEQVQLPMSIQAVIGQQSSNANSGPDEAAGPTTTGAAGASPMASRSPMGSAGQSQPQAMPPVPADNPGAQPQRSKRPPINAQTQGVIGIPNVTLSAASSGTQGSVLTSEKNNVKLESGTMLLLKVNQ